MTDVFICNQSQGRCEAPGLLTCCTVWVKLSWRHRIKWLGW